MIPIALVAAAASLAVVVHDFWRHPSDGFTVLRAPVAGVWAAVWLVYGLNPASFPAPETTSAVLVAAAWAISLMIVPGPPAGRTGGAPWRWDDRTNRLAFFILLAISAAVVAWNLWHLLPRVSEGGLAGALAAHRTSRTNRTGAYGIPGAEALSAIAVVTGVMGYGLWVRDRQPVGLFATILGLLAALLATGRWDVVSYGVWCYAVDVLLHTGQPARRVIASTARVFMLLAVFFVVHGKLLGKVDLLGDLADMSPEERLAVVNTADSLGGGLAAEGANAGAGLGGSTTGGRPGRRAPTDPEPPRLRDCERWEQGARAANDRFRQLPALVGVGVAYFAGPIAAFDRAVCENRMASRPVIFYWPRKIGTALGVVGQRRGPRVDPFVDIGVPFNNFTVFYPFLSEIGLWLGMLAWLLTALAVRRFVVWSAGRGDSVPLLVAATAPLTIAIRTPWINAFFDGTLVIWVGICLTLAALAARGDAVAAGLSAVRPARTSDPPGVARGSASTGARGRTGRRDGS